MRVVSPTEIVVCTMSIKNVCCGFMLWLEDALCALLACAVDETDSGMRTSALEPDETEMDANVGQHTDAATLADTADTADEDSGFKTDADNEDEALAADEPMVPTAGEGCLLEWNWQDARSARQTRSRSGMNRFRRIKTAFLS